MAGNIPRTMRAVALSKYCKPDEYNVATLPIPEISKPDELLIKVHAASVNPGTSFVEYLSSSFAQVGQLKSAGAIYPELSSIKTAKHGSTSLSLTRANSIPKVDVKMASGLGKLMGKASFPYKLGYDLAGVVAAVGSSVSAFKPGDEVYSRVPQSLRGSIAEYALSTESTTALKPKSLGFGEAASMPLAAQTALQVLYRGEEACGGLKDKTVFIPGALSGTGSFGVQLARNVFGARVVSTLSTGKMGKVRELLGEGAPAQIVDYTKEDVLRALGKGSVDFMFDTVGQTLASIPLMKMGSSIVSISTVPSGKLMREMQPDVPLFLKLILDVVNWFFETWSRWNGVKYSYLHLHGNREDLEKLAKWVDEGKVRPVVGMRVKMEDVEGVRRGCQQIFEGKGGVGKFVIDIA